MRYLVFIIWLLFPGNLPLQASPPIDFPLPGCSGFIQITGKTNINSFKLHQIPNEIAGYFYTATTNPTFSNPSFSIIQIPVKEFKADNLLLYKDFLQLVKASEYPDISIRFPDISMLEPGIDTVIKEVLITLAGTTRSYDISCVTSQCDERKLFLYGSRKLLLTDFNLVPPEKTFGLIKVMNEVIINFGFTFLLP